MWGQKMKAELRQIWSTPPSSRKEQRYRIEEIIKRGEFYPIPDGGTGAPGKNLENLLGIDPRNKDNADSNGVEIKFHSGGSPITLFHLECEQVKIGGLPPMVAMVKHYGWLDENGRRSFRHTIFGKSNLFTVVCKNGRVRCRPLDGKGPSVYWDDRRIENRASSKLGRLIVVFGTIVRSPVRQVRYDWYTAFDEMIRGADFVRSILSGIVAIDFDAREKEPGSMALRNHGTKFRIRGKDLYDIWEKRVTWGNGQFPSDIPHAVPLKPRCVSVRNKTCPACGGALISGKCADPKTLECFR
jgi:hypothetical protein